MAEDISEQVTAIVEEVLQKKVGDRVYEEDSANSRAKKIVWSCLKNLKKLQNSYKFIVTCALMRKNENILHTAYASIWDTNTDKSFTVSWENETTYCTVSVHSVAVQR